MPDVLLDDLKQQLREGHVLAIVGAGVSIAATRSTPVASWKGLLLDGIERCDSLHKTSLPAGWAGRQRQAIEDGDPTEWIGVAEQVSHHLGAPAGGEWSRWLRESVGALAIADPALIEALRDLGVKLATTNYDTLLEQVTGLPSVWWRDGARVQRWVRGDDSGVLHLHGVWDDPASVVLGVRDYERVVGDERAQAVQQALRTTRTLLFIGAGAGLEDPNFSAFLAWSGRVFASDEYRHFILVRNGEVATVQAAHPSERRIFALGYGDAHADLPVFLRGLVPPAAATPAPPASLASGVWTALPPPPHCVGRDAEVAQLVGALTAPHTRPVAVLGSPGIGKSTVALAALHDPAVVGAFGDRRQFVRCDTATSAEALTALVAPRLGLPLTAGVEDALCAELSAAPAVLVLDNIETPWQADTLEVERLLSRLVSLPGVRIVAGLRGTARPLLHAAAQWADPVEPRSLSLSDARAMFLAVAGNGYEGDPALDDLLIPLEGVPLAINLMACAAQGQPLAAVHARWLEERTSMLRRAGANHPLLNLETSYEVSISAPAIDGVSRRLLSTLAVFPGGVAHAHLPLVFPEQTFRAAGLLRQQALAFDEGDRLRLLAPLREYVAREYPPDDEDWRVASGFYIDLATRQSPKVGHAGRCCGTGARPGDIEHRAVDAGAVEGCNRPSQHRRPGRGHGCDRIRAVRAFDGPGRFGRTASGVGSQRSSR